jgi:hypothetical protein
VPFVGRTEVVLRDPVHVDEPVVSFDDREALAMLQRREECETERVSDLGIAVVTRHRTIVAGERITTL